MARNGSGVFTLVAGNPVVTDTTISSTWANNTLSDIATALTASLTKDGQTTPTANIPMGGFKLTGLAAGIAAGNSLRWEQLFSQGSPISFASAATTDIGAQNSVAVEITGTTTITGFGTAYNGPRFLRFTGILVLTHSATLSLPGAANITTAAGDTCIAYPNSAGTGWNVVGFQRAASLTNGAAGAGANSDITSLSGVRTIQPITAAPVANALVITLNPTALDFRNATLNNGAVTHLIIPALTLTVPATSNLGRAVSAGSNRLDVAVANSSGTPILCIVNRAGGVDFSEEGVISPTTIGASSNSATVIYSSAAVAAGSPYRVVGSVDAVFTDATGWTLVSKVQGAGGLALAALATLGQTWQSVTRTSGTTYYNNTGKNIQMVVNGTVGAGVGAVNLTSGGASFNFVFASTGTGFNGSVTIPPGPYVITDGNIASRNTYELR